MAYGLEAYIIHVKSNDLTLARGNLPAWQPLHSLWLSLTLDQQHIIVEVVVDSEATPYPGHCNTNAPAYNQLVGLNILKIFRVALKARINGALGCTHLTESAQILPTVALRAFSRDQIA